MSYEIHNKVSMSAPLLFHRSVWIHQRIWVGAWRLPMPSVENDFTISGNLDQHFYRSANRRRYAVKGSTFLPFDWMERSERCAESRCVKFQVLGSPVYSLTSCQCWASHICITHAYLMSEEYLKQPSDYCHVIFHFSSFRVLLLLPSTCPVSICCSRVSLTFLISSAIMAFLYSDEIYPTHMMQSSTRVPQDPMDLNLAWSTMTDAPHTSRDLCCKHICSKNVCLLIPNSSPLEL